jgi:hypothetical protein
MDMVISVKEAGILTQIDEISKTKIRAVFCLLKNSRAMVTSNGEGESVRISFGKGISTFRQFRERQDSFINKCLTIQQIFIPFEMKGDLIWQLDSSLMVLRLEELKTLELGLEDFFSYQISNMKAIHSLNPPPATRRGSRNTRTNRYQQLGSFLSSPLQVPAQQHSPYDHSSKSAGSSFVASPSTSRMIEHPQSIGQEGHSFLRSEYISDSPAATGLYSPFASTSIASPQAMSKDDTIHPSISMSQDIHSSTVNEEWDRDMMNN